ncbi:MAG: 5-(carboxyamino)imidazole ribonucleotide mutase [Pseudothermotoga sp.]|nr:5-(carboxyamino)imidazole ribonucleotide mutase [Pseudothermotoga sp.]
MKVAILVGSETDLSHARAAAEVLAQFEVPCEVYVLSAHRSPTETIQFARDAERNGFSLVIAMAGKAAHLPGVVAANTTLPVIGVPLSASLNGLDALLSVVQMPTGVPVACMAIDGAKNAALFAVSILALNNADLKQKLLSYRESLKKGSGKKDL